jgi:hypothetical protein
MGADSSKVSTLNLLTKKVNTMKKFTVREAETVKTTARAQYGYGCGPWS